VLHYDYLGDWQDRPDNRNIEESYLRAFLERRGYSPTLVNRALFELSKVATDQSRDLYYLNKDVYSLLRYGVKVRPEVGENTETVWLIDWEEPDNNHFAIAEEVTVLGENKKRPDIVLYVNGIALGVLELKRSTVTVSEGIRQNLDNQKKEFIRPFFTTMQLVMAGNDTEGLRYGTTETPEKYYLSWKEENPSYNSQLDPKEQKYLAPSDCADVTKTDVSSILDCALLRLCNKARFLEMIHDFIVFDAGTKKTCRHNQYFGIRAAQESVKKREGGIIWHTQGSGKSLTMVWLAKWLRENVTDARVLLITDRTELDEQIEKVFKGVSEDIYRTRSGQDLVSRLNAPNPWLLCSLVHKFAGKEEGEIGDYIAEVKSSLPADFRAKGNVFVFVDECHRTQSGELHKAMKEILPDALFIGFTGTPLLKKDKQKSIEVFGKYIHTYKFDEAVTDGVVLDLKYEARDIDQNIASPDRIDQWFAAKTKGLNDIALAQLKQKWGTMRKVLSSQDRLEKIVSDILMDFETKDRLQSGRGNAMLVSGSIYQACKLYELFIKAGFDKCAIVTSYKPSPADIKGEETGEGLTEKLRQYSIYNQMLGEQSAEDFEKDVKKKFIDEPGQMKLLIVVDKLLTGFDAPSATYLYIDKNMRDHGLFQAICRVNRLDGDDKEYGYIVDYKDLFKSLELSIGDYTSGALDGYEPDDVKGLLKDRLEKGRERLEQAREAIKMLCESVEPPKDTQAFQRYFCGDTSNKDDLKANEGKRLALYKLTSSLTRAYANLASELEEAGYSATEVETLKNEVDYYEKVRTEVKIASGDYIDLKLYEPAMRHLIDSYIRAEESVKISAFEDVTLIQLIVERGAAAVSALPSSIASNPEAVAETIENNVRRLIIEQEPTNPKYFEKMSKLLDELIKERKEQVKDYETYLQKVVELAKQAANPASSSAYPTTLNSAGKRALYDNLNKDEALAIAIDNEVRRTKKDAWRGNPIKEKEVRNAIKKHAPGKVDLLFGIIKSQGEY
jgi:type I restriction enzyme, R subunit